jgi:23S rRNA pseudouridine1911/1915/1917 synthase
MAQNIEEEIEDLQDDLFEVINLKVDKNQAPIRIDKYIINRTELTSRNRVQQAAKAGNILVNNLTVKQNYKVRPLDEITLIYPKSLHEPDLSPENIPLEVIFEDKDIIVINKQAGLVVHPGVGNTSGTLVNALLYHIKDLPVGDDESRAGLVHRLDKDTSGIMIVAKSDVAMTHLARQFFDRTIKRRYHALVWGNVEEDEGRIEGNIGRDLRNSKNYAVFPRGDYGKHAVTHYKVLERFGYVTLVECRLETGRTHQIRVHMKHIGHTLFNDERYGGSQILKGTVYAKYKQFVQNCFDICPRQALHAKSLGFIHPISKKELYFDSELPEDIHLLIEKWRTYSKAIFDKAEE